MNVGDDVSEVDLGGIGLWETFRAKVVAVKGGLCEIYPHHPDTFKGYLWPAHWLR